MFHMLPTFITTGLRSTTGGYVFTRVCLLTKGGGTYSGGGGARYLPWMGEGYLPCMGVPTLDRARGGGPTSDGGEGVPTLDGEGYLPWMGVPTLNRARGGGSYLGWGEGVPTLDGELPTLDGGLPTLDKGREYLSWIGGGGTYSGQVMPWTVCLLRFPAGGLSCLNSACSLGSKSGLY